MKDLGVLATAARALLFWLVIETVGRSWAGTLVSFFSGTGLASLLWLAPPQPYAHTAAIVGGSAGLSLMVISILAMAWLLSGKGTLHRERQHARRRRRRRHRRHPRRRQGARRRGARR